MVFAEDLKAALESSSRIKGCRVSVVEVNGLKETGVVKWEGISFYSSFVRKRKVCVLDMHLVLERGAFLPMNLAKEEPFSCKTTLGSACFKCQANDQNLFACEEAGCVKVFVTEAEVQRHRDTGEHLRIAECESTYHIIRTKWVEKVTGVSSIVVPPKGANNTTYQAESYYESGPLLSAGWALKKKPKIVRMMPEVKTLLVEKINRGSVTGLKADPVQVNL